VNARVNKRSRPTIMINHARMYTVLVVFALLASALLARAIDLQILRKDFYQNQGDARFVRQVAIPSGRGVILDRNGEPLAVSTPVESIWAEPGELLNQLQRLPELARLLATDAESLSQRLGQRSQKNFVYLKRHVSPDLAEKVRALKIPGVHLQREYRRFYPGGEVAAHLVGLTNIDDQGQEGLELAFDEWLRGEAGSKRVIKDLYGQTIENIELVQEPRPGRDLVTTIDRRLQYLAYRELKTAVAEHQAQSGSVIVLDVSNGEVLAMVNQPSYNPNQRNKRTARNRALTDFFEPGSVIKPFALAAALESGRFDQHSKINTSPGRINIGEFVIRDPRDYGTLDLSQILTKSSTVGMAILSKELDPQHLWDMYQRFGFGEVSGSGFPGESPGVLPDYTRWRETERATVAYGYGLSTTAMQLAQAYAAIANGGRIRAPSFVKDSVNPDHAVIDPQLSQTLIDMMERVTSEGTGTRGSVAHYRISGKTGTARKAIDGQYESRYVATFAGIAPASNPRIVAVAVINDPAAESYYAGLIAAPVFSNVMASALRLMNVGPDDLMESGHLVAGGQP